MQQFRRRNGISDFLIEYADSDSDNIFDLPETATTTSTVSNSRTTTEQTSTIEPNIVVNFVPPTGKKIDELQSTQSVRNRLHSKSNLLVEGASAVLDKFNVKWFQYS